MPRSGWLAAGALGPALLAPVVFGAPAPLDGRAASATGPALGGAVVIGLAGAIIIGLAGLAGVARLTGVAGPAGLAVARRPPGGKQRRRPTGPLIALVVGASLIAFRSVIGAIVAPPPPGGGALPAGTGPWPAIVESVGAPRAGQQQATLRLEGGERVSATLPRYPVIAGGDRVVVSGSLRPPPSDGYGRYLARIGAVATLRARSLEREPTPDPETAGGPARALEALRTTSADGLALVLPEPEAGLAAGILIGLRERVDRDLASAFTTAGVSHIVAISGWNIAIVGAVVAALTRRWPRRRRSGATVLAIVTYTAFAGGSPSVVRAALMAGVALLARESGRAGSAATALGWAVVILLVVDPRLIDDPGFQLSALATAGLIAWATPLTNRLERLTGGRLPGWTVEGLGVSLAAQAATLPVVLLDFGRLALVAPAVNLLVVPLVPPAMAAGAIALGAGWLALAGLPAVLARLLGLPAWVLLTAIVRVVDAAATLPFASVTLDPPLATLAAGMAWALIAAVVAARRRLPGRAAGPQPGPARRLGRSNRARRWTSTRLAAVALAAALFGLTLAAANRPDERARLTVLDVGQGDAILVEGGRGGRLLVDGGPDPGRLIVALDARLPPWDRRLDLVVLSHPHEDHVAGLALLLERYRVGRLFEPGMRGPGPGYEAFRARLTASGRQVDRLATGDHFTLDQIDVRVLWPDRGTVPDQPTDAGTGINNVSIVLLGEVGGRRFLLTGDIEQGVDPVLVARGLPRVELLKVAHHGSRTATTSAFLDAVRPSTAIISVGTGNPYGHPSPATIRRLEAHRARVWRTDRDGSVEVAFGPDEISVTPEHAPRPGARAASATWLLYHRVDASTRPDRSRRPPALPPPARVVPPAFARRGRGRGLAGVPDRGHRHPARPPTGRGGGPPPRRRQAPASQRPRGRAPPRPRVGGLAGTAGPPGARGRRCRPSGDTAARRHRRGWPGRPGHARGAGRRLRRQTRRPAAPIPRRPVRLVAPALPARRARPGRGLGRGHVPARAPARGPARGRRVRGRRRAPRRGPASRLDRSGAPRRTDSVRGGRRGRDGPPAGGAMNRPWPAGRGTGQ